MAEGSGGLSGCRMAPRNASGVVDQAGLVYGCQNLRVIDASVLPTIPVANVMLPTIMAAERLAAAAKAPQQSRR